MHANEANDPDIALVATAYAAQQMTCFEVLEAIGTQWFEPNIEGVTPEITDDGCAALFLAAWAEATARLLQLAAQASARGVLTGLR